MGRYRWFLIVGCGGFVWYWFPGWIFKGLSYFTWVCWLAPHNVTVNKLFGGMTGYGLMPTSFDWTVYSGYLQSPLIPPFHAIANVLVGIVVFFICISMGIHFTGTWYADYFPVQSSESYDNTGAIYNVSRILDGNFHFNETAYKEYSPLFLPTQFALSYGLSFAAVTAVVVHVVLYHGHEIWRQFKLARNQEDDVHMRLMKKYRDAEDWWYAGKSTPSIYHQYVAILIVNSSIHCYGSDLNRCYCWLANRLPCLGLLHLPPHTRVVADPHWCCPGYH